MNSSRARQALVIIGVMALSMAMVAAPASAAPGGGTVVFTCTASYPNYPGSGTATCSGTATGAVVTTSGQATFVASSFSMTYLYNVGGPTCPAMQTSNGSFSIGGRVTGAFTVNAVGATAALTLANVNGAGLTAASGSGVWVQESPNAVTNCLAGGGPMTATVVGALTFTDTN